MIRVKSTKYRTYDASAQHSTRASPTGSISCLRRIRPLKMMAFCLCRIEKEGPGLVVLDNVDLGRFLYSHFAAMNELFATYSLDEQTNRSISDNVSEYFQNAGHQ